jgi:type IV pilus assembly protein PilV
MNASPATQRGSTLLESLIAILVFSFGVLGMVGLQAASIKSISEAKYRTDAAFLANELIGQMWAERATITTDYTAPDDWADRVASTLPGGSGSVAVSVDPNTTPLLRTTVTVQWTVPGNATHQFVSVAQINGAGAI